MDDALTARRSDALLVARPISTDVEDAMVLGSAHACHDAAVTAPAGRVDERLGGYSIIWVAGDDSRPHSGRLDLDTDRLRLHDGFGADCVRLELAYADIEAVHLPGTPHALMGRFPTLGIEASGRTDLLIASIAGLAVLKEIAGDLAALL